MTNYIQVNKKWWDTITPFHKRSSHYNLKQFKKKKNSLQPLEIKELGNVKGKTMLHLMCHFGMDSLSWANLGAKVTGVDLSESSIELAQMLRDDTKIPATFLCSNIYDLPKVLDKQFDIIYMSYGVLLWLSDINAWAKLISTYLKKGGVFYIVELHPFTNMLSHELKFTYDYFDKGPFFDNSSGSYTNWNLKVKGETYQWGHTLSDVLNALIQVGLKIEFLHEFPFTMYNQFPGLMKKNSKGQYVLKTKKVQFPLLFSLKAKK